MDKVGVSINIVPRNRMAYINSSVIGSTKSTESRLNVNKVNNGYSVLFDEETFCRIHNQPLLRSIVKAFEKNLPDTILDITLMYNFDDDNFDPGTGKKVLGMDAELTSINDKKSIQNVIYTKSDNIDDIFDELNSDDEEDVDKDSDDDDEEDPFEILGLLRDEDRYSKKKHKYKSGVSKVYRNAKNPKRDVKRHGVIIADDKDLLKADERIIKEFLKTFIPGNASWKKDFRNELASRWIRMYTVTKKQLKKLERDHRKSKKKKGSPGLELTRRILTRQLDSWSDPNK